MSSFMIEKQCRECGNTFRTNNNSDKCYSCTLIDVTHDQPPEEGDFNTAGIISGTMTEEERSYLQKDLEQVEFGGSLNSSYFVEDDEEPDDYEECFEDYSDPLDSMYGLRI